MRIELLTRLLPEKASAHFIILIAGFIGSFFYKWVFSTEVEMFRIFLDSIYFAIFFTCLPFLALLFIWKIKFFWTIFSTYLISTFALLFLLFTIYAGETVSTNHVIDVIWDTYTRKIFELVLVFALLSLFRIPAIK